MICIGRDFKDHFVATPSVLNTSRDGAPSFSGPPIPLSPHTHSKKFLSYVESKPMVCQYITLTPCPVITELSPFLKLPLSIYMILSK